MNADLFFKQAVDACGYIQGYSGLNPVRRKSK